MKREKTCCTTQESLLENEHFWNSLYEMLHQPVTSFVRRSKLASWTGQEDDIVKDIIQETVTRVFKKFLTAPDEIFSIQSMEAYSYTIAYRYFLDLQRKEKRLSHLPQDTYEFETATFMFSRDDEMDTPLEAMVILSELTEAARIIVTIPNKQRRALLVDLARYNDFTEEPTLMEQAFAEVGIQLRDYCQLFPLDSLERSRHNSLLSLGYRLLRSKIPKDSDDHQVVEAIASDEPEKIACGALCG